MQKLVKVLFGCVVLVWVLAGCSRSDHIEVFLTAGEYGPNEHTAAVVDVSEGRVVIEGSFPRNDCWVLRSEGRLTGEELLVKVQSAVDPEWSNNGDCIAFVGGQSYRAFTGPLNAGMYVLRVEHVVSLEWVAPPDSVRPYEVLEQRVEVGEGAVGAVR